MCEDGLKAPSNFYSDFVKLGNNEIIENEDSIFRLFSYDRKIDYLMDLDPEEIDLKREDPHGEAIELMHELLDLQFLYFGTEFHPEIGKRQHLLGAMYLQRGKNEDAFKSFQACLECYSMAYGDGHAKSKEMKDLIEKLLKTPELLKIKEDREKLQSRGNFNPVVHMNKNEIF